MRETEQPACGENGLRHGWLDLLASPIFICGGASCGMVGYIWGMVRAK
jgi:hypothetical protein